MKVDMILGILENYPEANFQLHIEGYAEPGYTDPDSGLIATGNWNPRSWGQDGVPAPKSDRVMPRIADILDKLGVELEWEDEWEACGKCNKLVRTSPDSYGWTRSYWRDEYGEVACQDCVLEDPSDYLKFLEGNPQSADTLDLDLGEAGYFQVNEESFESGLYGNQCDNPEVIAESMRKLGVNRFVFGIDSVGQFDVNFSLWVHESEKHLLPDCDIESEGADPAIAMQSALKDASRKVGELEGQGVKVATCHSDGTATARLVSKRDFLSGKALD